jgi:Flp pilus assembly protein protease CpaA
LALGYILFAVVQDIRTKEIANWLSFSLIIFALGFRFFYSLFSGDEFTFLFNGLIGFGIFLVVGNLLYYTRIFAGGDAKLMIALGAILPYHSDFLSNIPLFFNFLLIFLSVGFLYIFLSSAVLCIRNFKRFKNEFSKQLRKGKRIMIISLLFSIIFLLLGFVDIIFLIMGILIFFIAYLYIYSKAADEACMVVKLKTKDLREGDWLYADLKAGRKVIKARWNGVTKKEIKVLAKKYREVKIRQGIPFSPVFLISFILFLLFIILNVNLRNPFG